MAGKKISELPTGTQVSGPELFPAVQSGTTKKFSLSTVAAWIRSAITPSSIGAQPTITANGILKGDGQGGVSAATAGTDYGTYSKPSGGIPASDLANGVIPSVPSAYTSNPAMDGTASPGSSGAWARGDHVHPSDTSKANQAQLATVETGTMASRAYAAGEYFCWNGLLYRVTATISSGGTFTPGTNCESVTASTAFLTTYPIRIYNTNLDSLDYGGIYQLATGNTNGPTDIGSINWSTMFMFGDGGWNGMQMIFANSHIRYRTRFNRIWNSWTGSF